MNSSKVIVMVMVIAFASLGLAVIAQTPSTATNIESTLSTGLNMDQSFIGKITQVDDGRVTTSPSIIYPYSFPYYGSFYPIDQIMRILLNADNAQYRGLSVATVKGVTTIKVDDVTATSSSELLHAVDFKGVIDKNADTISLTASSLDFEDGQSSFSGKNVSFTYHYNYAESMDVINKSDGAISSMPTK